MLSMFRNFIKSRVGLIVVFVFLGLIAVIFAFTSGNGLERFSASRGNVLAKVGNHEITDADLQTEIDNFIKRQRAQGQNVTMEQFLASPLYDQMIDQLVAYAALEEFSKNSGMNADSTLIESDIANNPDLLGFDGKFSQTKFDQMLAENRISSAKYRAALASDHYLRWMLGSVAPIREMPVDMIAPYASLQLERRIGTVGLIRFSDIPKEAEPDAKTLDAYYQRNRARYMTPPRRILRYAVVHPDQFKASSAATETQISAAYANSGVRFHATEKRTIHQLVMLDQAAATAAAAEVKGGKSLADVASARGLQSKAFDAVEKAALAKETSATVAEAAFSAPQGATVGPVKGPFGWVVLHVDTVTPIPAKSLAEAHATLADEITQRNIASAIGTLRQSLDDSAGDGANFDALMAKGKLTPLRTAALAPDGTDPSVKDSKPDPALAPIVQAGFSADPTDTEPQVVLVGQDGSFAVVSVEKALPAQLKPLASIHDQVVEDYSTDIRLQKARKIATDVVAAVNKGTPLLQALAATGLHSLLKPESFSKTRLEVNQIAAAQRSMPPQFKLMFETGAKHAKLIEAPGRAGYYIVYVDTIEPHDARGTPAIAEAQKAFGPALQEEMLEQFVESVKRNVKVTRYPSAIAAFRASLTTQGVR